MSPFRRPDRTLDDEDELWLRLDWALEEVFRDPHLAWNIAWQVAKDSRRYPEVREAAAGLMDAVRDDL